MRTLLGAQDLILLQELLHEAFQVLGLVILDLAERVVVPGTPPVVARILQEVPNRNAMVDPIRHLVVVIFLLTREVHIAYEHGVMQVLARILSLSNVYFGHTLIDGVGRFLWRHGGDFLLQKPPHFFIHEVALSLGRLLCGVVLRGFLCLLFLKLVLFLDVVQLGRTLFQFIIEGDPPLSQSVQLLPLSSDVRLKLFDLIPLFRQSGLPFLCHGSCDSTLSAGGLSNSQRQSI
mmetsp:Transcript_3459/g.7347  ORF Transcript_3459/g.7347 Transcript_3459/m.7347 type:complete len:233 (-) Transcript_3459:11-709(-)